MDHATFYQQILRDLEAVNKGEKDLTDIKYTKEEIAAARTWAYRKKQQETEERENRQRE